MTIILPTDAPMEYAASASGLILPRALVEERAAEMRWRTGVSLCSGCGGFDLGMVQAGFHTLAACDVDCAAAHTYMINLGAYPAQFYFVTDDDRGRMEAYLQKAYKKGGGITTFETAGSNRERVHPEYPGTPNFFLGDMRKLKGADILDAIGLDVGELDIVFGGPPCQGFSQIGKREVMDPRNSLVFEFVRLVLEMRPKTMALENVPGMITMVTADGVPVVDAIARMLEDGDYCDGAGFIRSIKAQHPEATVALRGQKIGGKYADPNPDEDEIMEPEQQELAI